MRYIIAVTSRALPGREADYDRWYDDVHVGEVLSLSGFLSCDRFRALDVERNETASSSRRLVEKSVRGRRYADVRCDRYAERGLHDPQTDPGLISGSESSFGLALARQ